MRAWRRWPVEESKRQPPFNPSSLSLLGKSAVALFASVKVEVHLSTHVAVHALFVGVIPQRVSFIFLIPAIGSTVKLQASSLSISSLKSASMAAHLPALTATSGLPGRD